MPSAVVLRSALGNPRTPSQIAPLRNLHSREMPILGFSREFRSLVRSAAPAPLDPILARALTAALAQVNSVVLGKAAQVKLAFACLLAGGHLLIEDLPGVGKTTLAHALAATLGLGFARIQFTAD